MLSFNGNITLIEIEPKHAKNDLLQPSILSMIFSAPPPRAETKSTPLSSNPGSATEH